MQGRLLLTMPTLSLCSVSRAVKIRYFFPLSSILRAVCEEHAASMYRREWEAKGASPERFPQRCFGAEGVG